MPTNIDNHEDFDPSDMDRPALVWDGDCGFCKRSVLRLDDELGERVRYVTYQSVHERFDQLEAADFAREVHLIEPDGRVYKGAEAIFRALDKGPGGSRLLEMYEQVPGFAALSEWGYRRVANNRPLASKLSRWFVGRDLIRPSWRIARWFFLRLLGVIGFIAFLSYFVQVDGLIGSNGIVPAAEYLDQLRASLADGGEVSSIELFARVPTLLWMSSSDAMISGVCTAGMVASAGLVFGLWPRMMLFLMWALYLSLATASGLFMGFQWDTLLLETTLFAIFLAPPGFWEKRSEEVSRAGLVLMLWLLFRLMFMSGVLKLTSGDAAWRDLSAMSYHFWTQPIPSWTSWWAHQMPTFVHSAATAATLVLEIAVPLLLFMPRRPRRLGAVLLGALQVAIIATGNYGFFNFLSLALCLLALDDAPFEKLLPAGLIAWIRGDLAVGDSSRPRRGLFGGAVAGVAVVVIAVSGLQMLGELTDKQLVPAPVERAYRPFRSLNNYGLFRVMTTERPEILVEGSTDGETWRTYDFKYKPDHLDERPALVAPHMPRLDWQMWFAALGECRSNRWVLHFQKRLLEGEDAVIDLLEDNPFAGEPANYIRTTLWTYEFTSSDEKNESGHWWRREEVRPYCPPLTLQDGKLTVVRGL